MTKEELIDKREDLMGSFKSKYKILGMIYADERCPAKVGDIIRGAGVWVKVEKIYYEGTDPLFGEKETPYCVFYGPVVTKQGVPCKSGAKKTIYPWALREVNGKKVKYDEYK